MCAFGALYCQSFLWFLSIGEFSFFPFPICWQQSMTIPESVKHLETVVYFWWVIFLVCNAVDLQTWSHALGPYLSNSVADTSHICYVHCGLQRAFTCIIHLFSLDSHTNPVLTDHSICYVTVTPNFASNNPKFRKVKWPIQGYIVNGRDKMKIYIFWVLCVPHFNQPWGKITSGKGN